uniref:Cytochrome c oxidase subunit 2 n=1 Tax=Panagrolaimus sp. JU765 TaxID=591449 RepID=A0AC34QBU4_9BILA
MLGVLVFVSMLFIYLLINVFYFKSKKIEYQFGELMCSIFPTIILLIQMFPSLSLLYYYGLMNIDRQITVKFDSYIKSVDQLNYGEHRLLEVDNRCVVPNDTNLPLSTITIKLDAIRGILSILNYNFPLVGVFYGQCSEICGANHRFIPIALEVTLFDSFKN